MTEIRRYTHEKKKLEIEVAELEAKLSNAGESFAAEISGLKADIEAKMAEIAALEVEGVKNISKKSAVKRRAHCWKIPI